MANTHVICVYKCPLSEHLYKIDLVERLTCGEYDERINTQYPKPIREKYYICFDRGNAIDAYKIMIEHIERFKYGRNRFYKLCNYKTQIYDAIAQLYSNYHFVIINHINDRYDTLRSQFIKRVNQQNIHDLYEYNADIKTYSLDWPEYPHIFYKFDWMQIVPDINTYGLKRAEQEIKKMAQDPQIFKKISIIGSGYWQLKEINRLNRKIPFSSYLFDICHEAFPMRR
jgi:hypothetical protein